MPFEPPTPSTPSSASEGLEVAARFRFRPQVLVFVLGMIPVFYCVREAIGAGIFAVYRETYRRVDLVLEEARPNAGSPYAAGHLEPGGAAANAPLRARGDGWVLAEDPRTAFAPGVRVPVWWSDSAPIVGYGRDRHTNGAPVAQFPALPGWPHVLAWSAGAVLGLWAVLKLMARAAAHSFAADFHSAVPLTGPDAD